MADFLDIPPREMLIKHHSDINDFKINAETVWNRIAVERTGEHFETENMVGIFLGQESYIYYNCPNECCELEFKSKDDWMGIFGNDLFTLSET